MRLTSSTRLRKKDEQLVRVGEWPATDGCHIRKDYARGRKLGEGSFGTVFEITEKKTGKRYACKKVEKGLLGRTGLENLRREIQILKLLGDHQLVNKLKSVYEDDKHLFLVLQLCTGGDLLEYLDRAGKLTEKDAAFICSQLAEVLVCLEDRRIVHLDLMPDNIFLVSSNSLSIQVGDFGIAEFCERGEKKTVAGGTIGYMAPEVYHISYDHKADVWSLGVILYSLLSASMPHNDSGKGMEWNLRYEEADLQSSQWATISGSCKNLISRMLAKNPDDRPSPLEIRSHPWIFEHMEPDDSALVGVKLQEQGGSFDFNRKARNGPFCIKKHIDLHASAKRFLLPPKSRVQ